MTWQWLYLQLWCRRPSRVLRGWARCSSPARPGVERRTAPPNIRALVPRVVVTSACHRACGHVCDASWGSHRSCSRTACISPHPVGVDLTSYWGRGWWTGGRRAAADAREARTGCCPDHRASAVVRLDQSTRSSVRAVSFSRNAAMSTMAPHRAKNPAGARLMPVVWISQAQMKGAVPPRTSWARFMPRAIPL